MFKSGTKDIVNNYRLITIFPLFLKELEGIKSFGRNFV